MVRVGEMMSFFSKLRSIIEKEEARTVGKSFGGSGTSASFSVPRLRDWVLDNSNLKGVSGLYSHYIQISRFLDKRVRTSFIASAIRFSFLIELTDLKVGSTKMKSRWLPGQILMPQDGSFEPIQGVFEPGNDPRAASFDECAEMFRNYIRMTAQQVQRDPSIARHLNLFTKYTRVPYEFPISYRNFDVVNAHSSRNMAWCFDSNAVWLSRARSILASIEDRNSEIIQKIENSKLSVKVYKTDRALTGKDKTNRAKRWEVLPGDFQHASLQDCWSVEKKLIEQLVCFAEFLPEVQAQFVENELIQKNPPTTRCPVTLAKLNYRAFSQALLAAQHGRSEYQIGHMLPLKRGGRHVGENVSWQSADGNRIQGDLSLREAKKLLEKIWSRTRKRST